MPACSKIVPGTEARHAGQSVWVSARGSGAPLPAAVGRPLPPGWARSSQRRSCTSQNGGFRVRMIVCGRQLHRVNTEARNSAAHW